MAFSCLLDEPDYIISMLRSYFEGCSVSYGLIQIIVVASEISRAGRDFFFYYFPVDFGVQEAVKFFRFPTPVFTGRQNSFSKQDLLRIFAVFYKRSEELFCENE